MLFTIDTLCSGPVAINPEYVVSLLWVTMGNSSNKYLVEREYTAINMVNSLQYAVDISLEDATRKINNAVELFGTRAQGAANR